jgi:hypothetical protein
VVAKSDSSLVFLTQQKKKSGGARFRSVWWGLFCSAGMETTTVGNTVDWT